MKFMWGQIWEIDSMGGAGRVMMHVASNPDAFFTYVIFLPKTRTDDGVTVAWQGHYFFSEMPRPWICWACFGDLESKLMTFSIISCYVFNVLGVSFTYDRAHWCRT